MTDRETMYRGLSNAAWGYFFLHFNFSLGSLNILPNFVGYLLFLSAIQRLREERRELGLLRQLCILLAAWTMGEWVLSWVGLTLDVIPLMSQLVLVASLYFHYQFITDMAALAAQLQPEGEGLDRRLLFGRTVYLLTVTAGYLGGALYTRVLENWLLYLLGGLAVAGLLMAVFLMVELFQLRRLVRAESSVEK